MGSDNHLGGYLATRHLLEQGRTRVSFVGERHMPELGLRYTGYMDAHDEAGLAADDSLGAKFLVDKLVKMVHGAGVRSKLLNPELMVRESSDPDHRAYSQ